MHIDLIAVALLLLVMFTLDRIGRQVESIVAYLFAPPERVAIYINGAFNEVKTMNLKDSQQLPLSIQAVDKFGNPSGSFDSAPAWSLVDPTLGSLSVSLDGLSALLVPSGKLGNTQVQVAALADGQSIAGSLVVSVIAGDAVTVTIAAGTPVDVPAPAPVAPVAPAVPASS